MVALDANARAQGFKSGIQRMSMAQKVFRKVSAGRFKERALKPFFALYEAVSFRDRLRNEMCSSGLDPEDSATAICFIDPDLSGLYSVKLIPGDEAKILDKMEKLQAVTIGLVIAIRDRQKDERIIKAYPFLKGDQSLKWLSEVLDREEVKRYVN